MNHFLNFRQSIRSSKISALKNTVSNIQKDILKMNNELNNIDNKIEETEASLSELRKKQKALLEDINKAKSRKYSLEHKLDAMYR